MLFRQLQLFAAEVGILFRLHRDEMDMGVGHFQAKYHLCYLAAGEGALDGCCHALGKLLVSGQLVVVHIKEVVNLTAWDDQRVAYH